MTDSHPKRTAGAVQAAAQLHIATLNVGTLVGRLQRVLVLLQEKEIDVLLLQETRVNLHSQPGMKRCASDAGYELLFAPAAPGTKASNLAVLTKWPAQQLAVPPELQRDIQIVRLHRHRSPPVALANVHFNPADAGMRRANSKGLQRLLVSLGGPSIIMGDFNMIPCEAPVISLVTAGWGYHESEAEAKISTRRRITKEGIVFEGRRIDYCLHTRNLQYQGREQDAGVADHDVISYRFKWTPNEVTYSFPKRRDRIGSQDADPITEAEWHQV